MYQDYVSYQILILLLQIIRMLFLLLFLENTIIKY